jgi:hypothetical protein
MDAEEQIESGIRADGPEDLRTLEDMIAADEAAETRPTSGDTSRDEAGRFKSSSAKDAQRAGERLTPEEIKASDFRKPEAKAKATADTAATKPAETETETKPDDSTAAADQAKADEAADAGKSAYRKEIDRRERSWESLNKQKAEFQAQRDEFELQRKTLEARERHLATKAGAAKRSAGERSDMGWGGNGVAGKTEIVGMWHDSQSHATKKPGLAPGFCSVPGRLTSCLRPFP